MTLKMLVTLLLDQRCRWCRRQLHRHGAVALLALSTPLACSAVIRSSRHEETAWRASLVSVGFLGVCCEPPRAWDWWWRGEARAVGREGAASDSLQFVSRSAAAPQCLSMEIIGSDESLWTNRTLSSSKNQTTKQITKTRLREVGKTQFLRPIILPPLLPVT